MQLSAFIRKRMLEKAQSRLIQNYKPNLSLPYQMVKSLIRSVAFKDIKNGTAVLMKEALSFR